MKNIRGGDLNELWGVGVAHALYIHDGHWYHRLKRFPAALFDRNGYIRFETEEAYLTCPHLQIRKQVSVPARISSIPGYVRATPGQEAVAAVALDNPQSFNPESIDDARKRTAQSVVQRQGQLAFRSRLLKAYRGRCCITSFDAIQALEAAHIYPYLGPKTNHPTNGLLLRADLHILFDQGLLGVDPSTMTVLLASQLDQTSYSSFLGCPVSPPARLSDAPSKDALEWHRRENRL